MMKRRVCIILTLAASALIAFEVTRGAQTSGTGVGAGQSPTASPTPASGLQEQLLLAQIANQKAQTSYYERQFSQSLLTAVQSLLAALAGAGLAFYGLWLQGRRQEKLERDRWERARKDEETKWERARKDEETKWEHAVREESQKWARVKEDERVKETGLAVAELAKRVTAAAHSLTWILWIAKHDSKSFRLALVREHDKRMNEIYTQLAGDQTSLAALDEAVYQKTWPVVGKIYYYDHQIGKMVAEGDLSDPANVARLGEWWRDVYAFSTSIPDEIARIMKLRKAPPTQAD